LTKGEGGLKIGSLSLEGEKSRDKSQKQIKSSGYIIRTLWNGVAEESNWRRKIQEKTLTNKPMRKRNRTARGITEKSNHHPTASV